MVHEALKAAALAAAALGLLSCGRSPGAAAAPPPPRPVVHTVAIEGMKFQPESLTVKSGDLVLWVNKDLFPHTATAEGRFDSKAIDADKSWQLETAAKGEFAYICTYHPTMKATLRVE
jgi:plastocyanin